MSVETEGGKVTSTLNQLGAEGWELVSAAPANGHRERVDEYMFCAKRALP